MQIDHNLVSSSASSTTQYGIQITTGAIVSGLPDSESTVQLDSAIAFGGIQIGSAHPSFPVYKCVDINSNSIGPNEVQIVYTWEYRFPETRYEIGSGVNSQETNIDKNGAIITADYVYPDEYILNPELAGSTDERSVMVEKLVPETTMTITRQESITGLYLLLKSKTFTGTVNGSAWGLTGDPAETWLCTGISGSSQDNGITYSVRYSFAYRPPVPIPWDPYYKSGWNAVAVWIDPQTDAPPADVSAFSWSIYPISDFNALGIV